jgi:site-specific recombinase XerD
MLIQDLAATWLVRLKNRKRKPVKPASLAAFSSYVANHINPLVGNLDVESFQSKQLKEFAEALVAKDLAPKTIHELVNVVQQIIKSAQDENGSALYIRHWNRDFILENIADVRDQHQPVCTKEMIKGALRLHHASTDKYRVMIALMLATGIRVGELLALRCGDDGEHSGWDRQNSLLAIRTSLWRDVEQKPKTASSIRMVDLSTPVNEMLAAYATNKQPSDFLFATRNGTPYTSHGLHKQALIPLGVPGFHSMRRWRVSYLKMIGTPEPLLKAWIGHSSGNDITARYDKSADDREWRQTWANKCGIGYLPEIAKPVVPPPHTLYHATHAAPAKPATLTTERTPYQATDDDLPIELFGSPTETLTEAK